MTANSAWWKVLVAIAIAEAAGLIGSFFTTPEIPTWYASLVKPNFAPPSWVFAPVWTTLFVLMGIASYLVYRSANGRRAAKIALVVYGIQLILNVGWSWLFFGQQNPGAALVEIGILWMAIAMTIFLFSRLSKAAAWLLVPYLAWVSFASYLNYWYWILNR